MWKIGKVLQKCCYGKKMYTTEYTKLNKSTGNRLRIIQRHIKWIEQRRKHHKTKKETSSWTMRNRPGSEQKDKEMITEITQIYCSKVRSSIDILKWLCSSKYFSVNFLYKVMGK